MNGLVVTSVVGKLGVGAVRVHGTATTSHWVVLDALFVQFTCAVEFVIPVTVTAVGALQVGAAAQVTLAIQPDRVTTLSLTNRNVKHPSDDVELNGPGIVVPQNAPGSPPGMLFPLFPLEI